MSSFESALSGKVVLVTGGTKGVGEGIAKAYLQAGATVVVCGREAPSQTIEEAGNKAIYMPCDVKDLDAAQRLFTDIQTRFGRLDVLVNNAGGAPFAMADKASPRFHESILRLNLIAPLNLAQMANQIMQAQGNGVIVFIGSIGASRAQPGTAAYGAAKAGILSLTKSLAVEWAPAVRVVTVSPGYVETELSHLHYGDEQGLAAVAKTIPMQRMAQPHDIGQACVMLSHPMSSYISGVELLVHGGGERPRFLDEANVNKA